MKHVVTVLLTFIYLGLCSCSEAPATQEPIESEPAVYYSVTEEERELLARLVYCEANTESLECQKAVVSVVFNQLDSGIWGDTLEEVIHYGNNYSPVVFGLLDIAEPNETNYEAVDYVIQNGPTLPTYVRYFRADYHHQWDGYKGYKTIDNVYFGYFLDWEQGVW